MAWAESILGAVGTVVRVNESLLDAVTGLSGSGPAYVFLVAEALVEGGVLAGLPRPVSAALATQTLLGAATLLAESPDGPEALRAAVTSPAGTTAAGLRALERGGVRSAVLDAVMAATERSRELGSLDVQPPPRPSNTVGPAELEGVFPRWVCRAARFLTPQEVADHLRVSSMTVYRLIKSGELRAVRVGKAYRLLEDDVDAYLAERFTQAG